MDILIGKFGNQPFKLTEPSISREHAFFHMDEATGKMTLRDNNSTNGTWIMAANGNFKKAGRRSCRRAKHSCTPRSQTDIQNKRPDGKDAS